jgi:hypothetical protein
MRAFPPRSLALVVFAFAAIACGGKHGFSICDNIVPPPAECMTQCDPNPGAPNTCPAGYHCTPDGTCDAFCTPTGGECGDGYHCTTDGQCQPDGACSGLSCDVVKCEAMGMPPTTISGTVFAPNGTLPLFGVTVYVPNADPGPLPAGAVCARCNDQVPGDPITSVQSGDDGKFQLVGVPSGTNGGKGIPLVLTIGKWRTQLTLPEVKQCQDNPLPTAMTHLPKNRMQGDVPAIAISTGNADALECLIRKVGIDDAEIGTAGGAQRIHLYTDKGSGGGQGADQFKSGFPGGTGTFADSKAMWASVNALKAYDIVIFSCEGDQHAETKSQTDMDAVRMYADLGGRVFMSHWHNIWIEGATHPAAAQKPGPWTTIATWNDSNTTFDNPPDTIDEANNPKGAAFANWMLNVMGSPAGQRDSIPIQAQTGKQTCTGLTQPAKAERWVFWNNGGQQFPQNFQFTTPIDVGIDQRCGKVVFSDMHVSGDSKSPVGTPGYPTACSSAGLTPQEKALAFMFFDISSCVGTQF